MERISTGIPGLDRILQGGLPVGSVFIVQGSPGAGKTVMANQICFRHASGGGRSVYVTLLAESHDRLLKHLSPMEFYQGEHVPSSIYYVSCFDKLMRDGLPGVLEFLVSEAKSRKASLLVLDGLFVLEETARSACEFRKFINDLAMLANLLGCTVLLLTNSARQSSNPEYTMVDGWIELAARCRDTRSYRTLTVHKVRGSDFIAGQHMFTISEAGLTVLPRFESVLPQFESVLEGASYTEVGTGRLGTGVGDLDRMLDGGLPCGSATLMLGPTGIGKTTLGLHFISQCTPSEPGLIFGFYENAARLKRRALSYGIDLDGLMASGAVEMIWHPSTENLLDQLGYELLDRVRQRKVARLFVDGVDALAHSVIFQERLPSFLTALTGTLRDEGVTTVYSMELPFLMGGEHRISLGSISAVAENIVLLRYVEQQSQMRRTLTLVKVRESGFDRSIREYSITDRGIRMGGTISGAATSSAAIDTVSPNIL
ncbi:ATPase domain-containing protein [Azospirillum sp. HJ39]|uniref:RAD55 family ATPase n=1 Tax=Azospirillum sp. HJ39 TaxID=3159496 RepID=UPI0035564112